MIYKVKTSRFKKQDRGYGKSSRLVKSLPSPFTNIFKYTKLYFINSKARDGGC
ncbi:hypothetical protein TREPR_3690 [Treponema primitia ZAS-2]|uniref:Uncharacterized protein n=1 Tax=Treponema primitia (strain ATCC BAA-887 / DSM 12427 / ZAS-2) TaxID=545694 RepID=F5YQE1_TREPZ|nr:hypothetical protein TREPR_3690 [Treponema primitia ZAS-2]